MAGYLGLENKYAIRHLAILPAVAETSGDIHGMNFSDEWSLLIIW